MNNSEYQADMSNGSQQEMAEVVFDSSSVAEDLSSPVQDQAAGLVSFRKPDGLILSTGNLYFTSHDPVAAHVWRTSQISNPGQEVVLYWEADAIFGDITFAQVDGAFWGYFFAMKNGDSTARIKRIPLTGGIATVIGPEITHVDIINSHRNLVADGVNLYWQDVDSLRKMPIRGGEITVLDKTTPSTPTAGIALTNRNIIYASVDRIHFVPTSGAITAPSVRTIVTATSRVTTFHPVTNGIYWGEAGAIRVKAGSTISTVAQGSGFVPTSIFTNGPPVGGSVVWTECGSQSCQLHIHSPVLDTSRVIGNDAIGVTVKSSGSVFWGDSNGVHRLVFE